MAQPPVVEAMMPDKISTDRLAAIREHLRKAGIGEPERHLYRALLIEDVQFLLEQVDRLATLHIDEMQPLLTTKQAAHKLGLSHHTVSKMSRDGRLPTVRLGDRVVRFDQVKLREFIDGVTDIPKARW